MVVIVAMSVAIVVCAAADWWLVTQRDRYRAEIVRLRASMSALERDRADQIVASERDKLRIAMLLLRRQAQGEQDLHLAVAIDSGRMYLERDGVLLRAMRVEVAPERRVGAPPDTVRIAPPRGLRTVERVLSDSDRWEVPAWLYVDRGLSGDSARSLPGALGPVAVILDGGIVIYAMPGSGPLNDSGYVLPGALRASASDLRAILPNITAGMRVYFY